MLITGAAAIGVGKAEMAGRPAEDTVPVMGRMFAGVGRTTVVI